MIAGACSAQAPRILAHVHAAPQICVPSVTTSVVKLAVAFRNGKAHQPRSLPLSTDRRSDCGIARRGDVMPDPEGLTIIRVHAVATREFAEEKITGILLPETTFSSASIGFVPPFGEQSPHYQNRPEGGDEIIFVYEGRFSVVSGNQRTDVIDTKQDGPIYILVRSGTPASLENRGSETVRFFSVFAPPFAIGETHFLRAPSE